MNGSYNILGNINSVDILKSVFTFLEFHELVWPIRCINSRFQHLIIHPQVLQPFIVRELRKANEKKTDWCIESEYNVQNILNRLKKRAEIRYYVQYIGKYFRRYAPNSSSEKKVSTFKKGWVPPVEILDFWDSFSVMSMNGADPFNISFSHEHQLYEDCLDEPIPDLHTEGVTPTQKWVGIGTEAEFDAIMVCCDPSNEDYGAISVFVTNCGEGCYVCSDIVTLLRAGYSKFKRFEQDFSEKAIKQLVRRFARSGSSADRGGDCFDLFRSIRGWVENQPFELEKLLEVVRQYDEYEGDASAEEQNKENEVGSIESESEHLVECQNEDVESEQDNGEEKEQPAKKPKINPP